MYKAFVKSLIIGCGLVLPFAIIGGIVYASQVVINNSDSIGNYDIVPNGYAFTWLEKDETCQEMSIRLGVQVNQIQTGSISIGKDSKGMPIIKQGKVVIFDKLPTTAITDKLDYEAGIQGFQRAGGKSIVDTLQKVDTSVIK